MNKVISDLKESFKNFYIVTDDRDKVELFVEIAIDLGYSRFDCQTNYMMEWDTVILSGNPSEIMGSAFAPIDGIEVTLHELLTLESELSKIIPHPHAETIKAFSDGYPIEMFAPSFERWVDTPLPNFLSGYEYRVKGFTELGTAVKEAVKEARIKKTKEIDLARANLKDLEDELARLRLKISK